MKTCPFCNTAPQGTPSVSGNMFWRCGNSLCVMSGLSASMTETCWNDRPGESKHRDDLIRIKLSLTDIATKANESWHICHDRLVGTT